MPARQDDVWSALLLKRERAFRVARSRCGTLEEVEDCVQEAMTRVASMPDIDLTRVGPLLTTVVANLAVDGHRARTRRHRLEERLTTQWLVQESPDDEVCDVLEARWLWTKRHDLPEQDRRVLELRAEGRSLPEVASTLGLTYKAAENALGRARTRMRVAWRSTAALLGAVAARRWTRVAGAAGLPAALILALGGSPFAHDASRPATMPPAGALPQAQTATAGPTGRAPGPRLGQPTARQTVTGGHRLRTWPAVARTIIRSPATNIGRHVAVGPASVEERHPDESLQQTMERCLNRGVTVTPTEIRCNG